MNRPGNDALDRPFRGSALSEELLIRAYGGLPEGLPTPSSDDVRRRYAAVDAEVDEVQRERLVRTRGAG